MTEKNGGTARLVCNGLCALAGWVIISSDAKRTFIFTASFQMFQVKKEFTSTDDKF